MKRQPVTWEWLKVNGHMWAVDSNGFAWVDKGWLADRGGDMIGIPLKDIQKLAAAYELPANYEEK